MLTPTELELILQKSIITSLDFAEKLPKSSLVCNAKLLVDTFLELKAAEEAKVPEKPNKKIDPGIIETSEIKRLIDKLNCLLEQKKQ